MRLEKIQRVLKEKGMEYAYNEEDGCGSLDFLYRGIPYHIWEFADGKEACGVETNIRNAGRTEDIEGDYEETVCRELKSWP